MSQGVDREEEHMLPAARLNARNAAVANSASDGAGRESRDNTELFDLEIPCSNVVLRHFAIRVSPAEQVAPFEEAGGQKDR